MIRGPVAGGRGLDSRGLGTRGLGTRVVLLLFVLTTATAASPQSPASGSDRDLPLLTAPVNDFAHIIDSESAAEIDRISRALEGATGDTIVVVTVQTFEPYADIEEYAVKLFENHGRGIGHKGKDNGVLIVASMKPRRIRIEVGYDLEQWITDGFAGETIREFIAPLSRQEQYGPALLAGVERIAGRIAQARGISLDGLQVPRPVRRPTSQGLPLWLIILVFILFALLGRTGRRRGPRYWGGGPWSGWSSGVGPFGGGWSSGGGGGFGGGFGGFGGGRSGGGGASGSW